MLLKWLTYPAVVIKLKIEVKGLTVLLLILIFKLLDLHTRFYTNNGRNQWCIHITKYNEQTVK
jgi:hypothetical protein